MYTPSDDTFLLADSLSQYNGWRALEIGVGSGLLLNILKENFVYVVGSDIDLRSLQHCKQQISSSSNVLLVCCDAGSAFGSNKFDFIISNPPYLPNEEDRDMVDPTVYGGPAGIEATVHFVNSALPLLAKGGKMLVVISSLADPSNFERMIVKNKIQKKIVREKRLFYETLSIVELSL
ncbi:MAG: methyltransferase [Thermoproteota archaeon]|nr:methyltransferase [Thermoproteota archaeon]